MRLGDARDDLRAIVLHRREVLLHRETNGFVDVFAHLLEGVGDGHGEVVAGKVDGGKLERVRVLDATGEVLRDLDEHALAVVFFLHLVRLGHVVRELLGVRLVESFDGGHRALAQRLADGVEEDEDEIDVIGEPHDGLDDVEGVLHLAVHQAGGVHELHAGEVLVLAGGDLGEDVVGDALETLQALDVVVKRESGVPLERLALATAGDEGEAAGLDGHARGLHGLADVPVDERGLARAVVADDHHVHLLPRLVDGGAQIQQGVAGDLEKTERPVRAGVEALLVQLVDALQDALGAGHPERVIVGRLALLGVARHRRRRRDRNDAARTAAPRRGSRTAKRRFPELPGGAWTVGNVGTVVDDDGAKTTMLTDETRVHLSRAGHSHPSDAHDGRRERKE